jgi:hypothetical protein
MRASPSQTRPSTIVARTTTDRSGELGADGTWHRIRLRRAARPRAANRDAEVPPWPERDRPTPSRRS